MQFKVKMMILGMLWDLSIYAWDVFVTESKIQEVENAIISLSGLF